MLLGVFRFGSLDGSKDKHFLEQLVEAPDAARQVRHHGGTRSLLTGLARLSVDALNVINCLLDGPQAEGESILPALRNSEPVEQASAGQQIQPADGWHCWLVQQCCPTYGE